MREIVIVPTYQRSDMLFCCLEAIRAAQASDKELFPVFVFPDRGTDETEVCEKFGVYQKTTLNHNYHGNSCNVMEALKFAYQDCQADLVYIIEDDAIIDPSFFSWCRAALANPMNAECFAACGWQYSPDAIIGDGPDLRIPWYLSVCAAIPRRSLYGIVQHARPEYYSNMQNYLDRAYPQSHRRGSSHYEQDGLALRVCESMYKRCVWPRRPRATHIGFYGYHMDGKCLSGTIKNRVAILRLALKNPGVLKSLMSGGTPPDMGKCDGCGKPLLTENKNARLVCTDCFHQTYPALPRTTTSHYYLASAAQTE
jgi:glycosyltransferase involved in cell wall biosynthesis